MDFWKKYRDLCLQCTEVITGPVMVAGHDKFHPECFACRVCGYFIGEGESFALVDRSKLFCGSCYKLELEFCGSASNKKPHTIQLIELPSITDKRLPLRLVVDVSTVEKATFRISQFDASLGLPLQIGDRVLELNGRSVSQFLAKDFERIILQSIDAVQLTIEHDPDESSEPSPRRQSFPAVPFEEQVRARVCGDTTDCSPLETGVVAGAEGWRRGRERTRDGGCRERSSSLPKFLDHCSSDDANHLDLNRTRSFRKEILNHRIFRPSDLTQGELLGRGFYGQAFKVTHSQTGEVMVLKELIRLDEQAQKNFLKEVAVLRNLHHKNVLKFVGILYRDRKLHLVTEFISGGTLKELIHSIEGEELNWEQRLGFVRDIASGMKYLHSCDIIHRDLNSHNCLVRQDKSVVVADFGLARVIPHRNVNLKTNKCGKKHQRKKRYTVVGNPYWMAPEMMTGNKYDEKVDIFSFGIIMCEVIGRVEADPDFMPRSLDFGLNENIFREKYCRDCPQPFYTIAFLCCCVNPDKRPPFTSLESWLQDLVLHFAIAKPLSASLLWNIFHYSELQRIPIL